MGKSVDD